MASQVNHNKKVIESAFAKFAQNSQERFKAGMEHVLNFLVEDALASHDSVHQRHNTEKDGYGWILYYNGRVISQRVWNSTGSVEFLGMLHSIQPEEGWFGVVVANMKPAMYFAARYEFWVLRKAIKDLKDTGSSQYFVRVNE